MELTGNTGVVPLTVGTCSGADWQHWVPLVVGTCSGADKQLWGCTCHDGDLGALCQISVEGRDFFNSFKSKVQPYTATLRCDSGIGVKEHFMCCEL